MDVWKIAKDVSSIGDTRRGREGDNRNVDRFEVPCGQGRGLGVLEGCGLVRGEIDPRDNRENASMHVSRSLVDMALRSRLDPFTNTGMCVTNEMGSGGTCGG